MPIEFTCPHCQSLLRVDDANAGKRARCPQCNVVNRIPGEPVQLAPTPTDSQQFFIESVSGQTFGPVTQNELDRWVREGRVSAECRIRPTGQASGQPASVYYPSLGIPTSQPLDLTPPPEKNPFASQHAQKPSDYDDTNPYMVSSTASPYQSPLAFGDIRPVEADLGQIFSRSYDVFKREMGLLLGAAVTCGAVNFVSNMISRSMEEMHDGELFLLAFLATVVLNLIYTFLLIGQTRIALKLVRGQSATYGDLFDASDKFLPVIGFYFLIFIPLLVGFLLLIIPGILLMLYFWPAFTLIVDRKTGVFESFGVAREIGSKNLMNSFLLGLASFGIVIGGLLLCCVGVFFSAAFLSVLWATAYLVMSGQIR